MCDKEEALVIGFSTVWPEAKQQLCQEHFIGSLSEPVHQAGQQLQGELQEQLRGLPQPPKLSGESRAEQQTGCFTAEAEARGAEPTLGHKEEVSIKKEVQPETSRQKQARQLEPLLKNLLFPQQPLALVDRENGRPISREAALWDHYYRYYRLAI